MSSGSFDNKHLMQLMYLTINCIPIFLNYFMFQFMYIKSMMFLQNFQHLYFLPSQWYEESEF